MTPFFTVDGLRRAGNAFTLANGSSITAACRMLKTLAEIALIQRSMNITLEVHKAAARIMREGITTTEVLNFLQQAHVKLGATLTGSGIVLFGEPTSYPHGVPYPQTLKDGDMVLIDVGAEIEGYRSDITPATCSANRLRGTDRSGTWRKRGSLQRSARRSGARRVRRWMLPRGASSRQRGSGPATLRRGCRIGPGTGSGSTCTRIPTW
jgi:hypothetical protein